MKYSKIVLLFILLSSAAFAQTGKNAVKAGYCRTSTLYNGANANGFDLQCGRNIAGRWYANLAFGQANGKTIISGRASGPGYDNAYSYTEKEKFTYVDLSAGYGLFKPAAKFDIRPSLGVSYVNSVLNYAPDMYIEKGIIVRGNFVDEQVGALLAHLGLEFEYAVTKRILVYAKADWRTWAKEQKVLSRKVLFEDGFSLNESGINSNYSLVIGAGYAF